MALLLEIDYYAILEITEEAESEEIRRAYRRLSLLRHPDKNPNDSGAHEAFCILNDAYDTLKDASRRILYNAKYPDIKAARKRHEAEQERQHAERQKQDNERANAERLKREKFVEEERLRREEMANEEAGKKRQEEVYRENEAIRRLEDDLKKVDDQIKGIEAKRKARLVAEKNGTGWWGYMTSGWGKSPEVILAEKAAKEVEMLQKVASERIKMARLESEKKRIEKDRNIHLQTKQESASRESMRLRRVRRVRERREAEAREAAEKEQREQWEKMEENLRRWKKEESERPVREEARRKKEESERIARQKAEAVRRAATAEKAREDARRYEENRKKEEQKAAEEREERLKARLAREREERHRKETLDRMREQEREFKETFQRTKPEFTFTDPNLCSHVRFWPKVSGRHKCKYCAQTFHKFVLQCPDCQVFACAECKRGLGSGRRRGGDGGGGRRKGFPTCFEEEVLNRGAFRFYDD